MPPPSRSGPAMPHRTTVALEYDGGERTEGSRGSPEERSDSESERLARIVERSLAREVGEIDDDRSTTRLARDGRVVELAIEAADLVALRAAANTWLSLAGVAERVAATAAGAAAGEGRDGEAADGGTRTDDGTAADDDPATDRGPETGDF